MDFQEWVKSQFKLTKLENGRIHFQTPCINYTFSPEDFEILKKIILEFDE